MICPICKGRWAPFPDEDFQLIKGKGFVPKNNIVEKKRSLAFDNNDLIYCGCEEKDWKYFMHYRT